MKGDDGSHTYLFNFLVIQCFRYVQSSGCVVYRKHIAYVTACDLVSNTGRWNEKDESWKIQTLESVENSVELGR